jgi:hypothetical protein
MMIVTRFLHPDGKTLFFCSKGHNSMGGYDVFRCYYDPETDSYGTPMNLDYKLIHLTMIYYTLLMEPMRMHIFHQQEQQKVVRLMCTR